MAAQTRPRGRPKSLDRESQAGSVKAVDRAIDVLEKLAGSTRGMSLSEIAVALDQSPATVHRMLATLERRMLVEADLTTQTWRIGAGTFRIGSAFLRSGGGVAERSRPAMRALMEQTGETANLGIERGGSVMFVGQVETQESIRAFFPPGSQAPMHSSGIGKALLSCCPEERLSTLLDKATLEGFTDHTITDPATLRADLAEARRRGFAFDDEERTIGMRCIAAPILDAYGEAVAGVSISGPTSRVSHDRVEALGAQVVAAARDISRRLGAPDAVLGPASCDD